MIWIERWSERPEWKALAKTERAEFIARIKAAVEPAMGIGIELLAAGDSPGTERDHFAVWRGEDPSSIAPVRGALLRGGWYGYFDQIDIISMERALPDILKQHVED